VLDGTVIGRNRQRHRHQKFIRFLNTVEAQVPVGKVIYAVFCPVVDLEATINRFVEETNDEPTPSSGPPILNRVLAAVARKKRTLESVHQAATP
jgi:hypothetical protein